MKRTVSDLMKQIDLSRLPLIEADASVEEALKTLESSDVGALLVISNGAAVDVFSERDFARAYVANKSVLRPDTTISKLMSSKVIFVTPDYRLDECMAVMVKMKIRHLPVLQGETPIAFLSMRHIMEALAEENKFMVNQLVTYITGSNTIEENQPRKGLVRQQNVNSENGLF